MTYRIGRNLVIGSALAMVLTGCGGGADGKTGAEADGDQLPPVPQLNNLVLQPQDTARLPVGVIGERYNAIPPCEVVKREVAVRVAKADFAMKEEGVSNQELRGCSSQGDNGETLIVTTRVDKPNLTVLSDKLKDFLKSDGQVDPYEGPLSSTVRSCYWITVFKNPAKTDGMACQAASGVTVTISFQRGAQRSDIAEMMSYALAVQRQYYNANYAIHSE